MQLKDLAKSAPVATTPPPVEAPPTPKRLSWQDACNALLRDSRLKALAEGEGEPTKWAEALNADVDAADTLLANLAEDLTRITGVTAKAPSMRGLLAKQANAHYPSPLERVKTLWKTFHYQFSSYQAGCINNIANRAIQTDKSNLIKSERKYGVQTDTYGKTFYPCYPVSHLGDTAEFKFVHSSRQAERLYRVRLATPSYVDPQDHTMAMPQRVHDKLEVLKTTHFDYAPKVLRGVQVGKDNEVMTEDVRSYYHYDPDPALVVHFGLQHRPHVVDFWEEPAKNEVVPIGSDVWSFVGCIAVALLLAVLAVAGVSTWWTRDWHVVADLACTGGGLIAALFAVGFVMGGREYLNPKNLIKRHQLEL